MYYRYHVNYTSPKTGQHVGLFVAVWHLLQKGVLSEEEAQEYWRQRRYFEDVLPIPPFYANGNPEGAVTWFKDSETAREMAGRLSFYTDILRKYGVELMETRSEAPGRIIYEDEYQIGVIP